jgi:spore coat polysaccharide biosynthesis protein SpsF (cytidylyltransferase family)
MNVAIVQARMGSTRLPGKTLKMIEGKPAIWHLFHQLSFSQVLNHIVLATTVNTEDDELADFATSEGWKVFRGDESDVLARYYFAAIDYGMGKGDLIVRLTGDDIYHDPYFIDTLIGMLKCGYPSIQYVCNNRKPQFPYGFDVEVFSFECLEKAYKNATKLEDREHVTPYIRRQTELKSSIDITFSENWSDVHLSIDRDSDLERNRILSAYLAKNANRPFRMSEVLRAIKETDLKS